MVALLKVQLAFGLSVVVTRLIVPCVNCRFIHRYSDVEP